MALPRRRPADEENSTKHVQFLGWWAGVARLDWWTLSILSEYMARNRNRKRDVASPSPFEQARDEMFQQIIRCGVLQASPEPQRGLDQTIVIATVPELGGTEVLSCGSGRGVCPAAEQSSVEDEARRTGIGLRMRRRTAN